MGAVVLRPLWIEGRSHPTEASEILQETHDVILLIMSVS